MKNKDLKMRDKKNYPSLNPLKAGNASTKGRD